MSQSSSHTSRIAPIVPGTRPELAAIEARIIASRGRITKLYEILLNSPAVVDGWEAMLTAIRLKTSIDPRLRELIILRVAMLNGAPYEFEAHAPHAEAAGVSKAAIESLRQDGKGAITGVELDETDRLVLALADAMTVDIVVPDALYESLAALFGDTAMLELTATVAAYNMVSRFLVALHIGH